MLHLSHKERRVQGADDGPGAGEASGSPAWAQGDRSQRALEAGEAGQKDLT